MEAIATATAVLERAHVASPRVDAELLAAFVLGIPRGRLHSAGPFTPRQRRSYHELITARAGRVPLQHLTGTAPFRHLEVAVGAGVFVPRPESEVLVEWGLRWLAAHVGASESDSDSDSGSDSGSDSDSHSASGSARAHALVVDLCAGSGAIAASVATEAPGTKVVAVECDEAALVWLRRNVEAYGVRIIEGDVTDPTTTRDVHGLADLVLCNPPYVPDIGAAGLPVEVTDHEPRVAVFGGEDGLDVIRPLIGVIAAILRPGGAFALEHDDTHAYVVPTLVSADGRFTDVALHHDLAGRPRFTTAMRVDEPAQVADLPS